MRRRKWGIDKGKRLCVSVKRLGDIRYEIKNFVQVCGSLATVSCPRLRLINFRFLVILAATCLILSAASGQTAGNSVDPGASAASKSNNNSNKTQNSDVQSKKTGQATPGSNEPAAPKAALEKVELETKPHDFESLGLKIQLPKGTLVAKESAGNTMSWMVADERDPARWFFRLQAVTSSDPQSDTESQMQNHLQSLKTAGSQFTLLFDRPTKICGLPARFFWLSTPTGEVRAISGWFMLQTGIGNFIVFSILTTEKDFEYAESALDRAVSTIELRDMSAVQKERDDRLQLGSQVLKSFTPALLKKLADGKKRLFRSWLETPQGDVEQAWIAIEISQAPRGMVDPGANAKNLTESGKEAGFLISIDSRSIGDDGLTLTSSRNRYWLAWDCGSEAWSVRSVPQVPGPKNIFSQTGARLRVSSEVPGKDLAVLTSSIGASTEPQSWTIPSSAYLPHPLSFMLAEMLPREANTPKHFAFWSFDPASEKISQRTCKWNADAAHPGQWLLETQTSLDGPTTIDVIDAQGHLAMRKEANGVRMAPTTLLEIERLWKAKGLQP